MFSGARQPQHARTAVRLLPREEEFFDLFVEVATRSTLAAQHLRELFDAPPDRRIAHVEAIKRLEHEADQVTRSEERRVGKEWRSRGTQHQSKGKGNRHPRVSHGATKHRHGAWTPSCHADAVRSD